MLASIFQFLRVLQKVVFLRYLSKKNPKKWTEKLVESKSAFRVGEILYAKQRVFPFTDLVQVRFVGAVGSVCPVLQMVHKTVRTETWQVSAAPDAALSTFGPNTYFFSMREFRRTMNCQNPKSA